MNERIEPLTASEVLNKVYQQLGDQNIDSEKNLTFDSKYKQLFAIWVTSAYLELQLQPTHRPFTVLANWDSLLEKHGPIEIVTDPQLIRKDEPNLSFQRNVFCDKSLEIQIEDTNIGALRLLYFEAKLNVLDGRYPYEDYELLAAIQAAIELGPFEANVHSVQYFRQRLNEYIPCNYMKSGDTFNGLIRTLSRGSVTTRCAQKIVDKYRDISNQKFTESKQLRTYLDICRQIPVCYLV